MEKRKTVLAITFRIAKAPYIGSNKRPPEMETVMTATTIFSDRTRNIGWNQIARRIGEWQRRARSRQELHGLSDATLRDIGISRCDAHREARKPFWMA
jgi:uncharacterized protein YjiS (DUF1127 family)